MHYSFLVHHFLEHSADRLPDKVALICGDKRLTYREINEAANRLATNLVHMGIQRQDRVIIFLDNSAESVISLFGILKAGAIFLIVNPSTKAKKLNYILKDSGAKALITQPSKTRIISEALSDVKELKNIVWLGKKSQLPAKVGSSISAHLWHEVLSVPQSPAPLNPQSGSVAYSTGVRLSPSAISSVQIIDLDLACIIYTSGSTANPKGVMSAHSNVVAAARSITHYLENIQDDIILNALPLSFDYGLYQVLMAFLLGGTVVLEKSFMYPYKVLERLVQERATGFPIVPTMAAILLQLQDLSKFDFGSLRYITNTAAALPVSVIRKLQTVFPQAKIYSMYGLTECKRVSYLPPDQLDSRPESVGIPMPNEEVFIVSEQGQEVGPGDVGELLVRGSNVMQGYWNAPEETARTFKPGRCRGDTLLYTGDLFRKDEEGFLYFVARRDDLIKTRGERVSPKEIENALCEIDGVIEAAVIGVADEILGQAIKAFVVVDKQAQVKKEKVLRYCQKNLEPFLVPKYLEFRNSLPKSSNGKIDKKKLS